jgi:hypothetical protein
VLETLRSLMTGRSFRPKAEEGHAILPMPKQPMIGLQQYHSRASQQSHIVGGTAFTSHRFLARVAETVFWPPSEQAKMWLAALEREPGKRKRVRSMKHLQCFRHAIILA